MPSDVQDVAHKGRRAVAQELRGRGAEVTEVRRGNLHLLELRKADGQRIHIRVKTRTAGTWQGSIRDGDPDPVPAHPERFWAFVDLKNNAEPQFYIVPDTCMRQDIHLVHRAYLARHGGKRAITNASTHHSIALNRIVQWKDRWDRVGL